MSVKTIGRRSFVAGLAGVGIVTAVDKVSKTKKTSSHNEVVEPKVKENVAIQTSNPEPDLRREAEDYLNNSRIKLVEDTLNTKVVGRDISPKFMVDPKIKMTDYDRMILTKTLYSEARGEPEEGIHAVAHVIFNRVKSEDPLFAKDTTVSKSCLRKKQFSCWLFKLQMAMISTKSDEYKRIERIMYDAHMRYELGDDAAKGSTFYIVKTIKHPSWTAAMRRVMILGNHEFFGLKTEV